MTTYTVKLSNNKRKVITTGTEELAISYALQGEGPEVTIVSIKTDESEVIYA